jgi:hypothetical protein
MLFCITSYVGLLTFTARAKPSLFSSLISESLLYLLISLSTSSISEKAASMLLSAVFESAATATTLANVPITSRIPLSFLAGDCHLRKDFTLSLVENAATRGLPTTRILDLHPKRAEAGIARMRLDRFFLYTGAEPHLVRGAAGDRLGGRQGRRRAIPVPGRGAGRCGRWETVAAKSRFKPITNASSPSATSKG